jgi:predicted P-loop ATPase
MNRASPEQIVTTNIQMVQNYLDEHYKFKYNANTNRLLFKSISGGEDYHYLVDFDFNTILKNIKTANISCSKELLRTVLYSDYVSKFDPFLAFLNGLPEWDGTDYVSLLADSVKTTDQEHWKFCLRKWLVALVASLLDKKVTNHTAIIFSGPQGIGKTRWFHTIIPESLREFIYEGYIHPKDKETSIKLSECILILMDELENMSDKNIDALKMLMTQESIYLRRAYQTMSQSYNRRASFAGTVNKKQFLTDLTGNRRFLCFEVEAINLNHDVPLEQLYAQLIHLYKTGFHFWFNEDEIALLNEKNSQFRFISVEEEALTTYYEPYNGDDAIFLQTTQIQQTLVQKTGFKSFSIQSLGHILRDMKFKRIKKDGVYGYLVKEKQDSSA